MSATIPLSLDGYTDLPPGKLANVVTYLAWHGPTDASPARPDVTVRMIAAPSSGWFRALYWEIGTDFLWCSRAVMSEAELSALLSRPTTAVLALEYRGETAGLVEIDFSVPGAAEIVTFGVLAAARGTGAAGILMDHTLAACRRPGVARLWLHTCNFDHPAAIGFYRAKGFRPYKSAIEVFDDPRLTGVLPANAAPQIPLIGRPAD